MHQPASLAASFTKRFVEWEEQFISHDRGSRVVHYYLKDRNGSESLAVVGTERSLRHMVYVVCDEFLPLAGLDKSTTPAFKWRSRREVVDWLTTFLTKPRCSPYGSDQHVAKSPKYESSAISDPDATSNGEDADFLEGCSQDEDRNQTQNHAVKKQYGISGGDVLWLGAPWSCRKRLRHYHSFQRNGITISVNAFVYVMSEGKEHHIAYIEDMYEDRKSKKKVRVRWFHKTDELVGPVPPPVPQAREVFITPFPQVLSVECVDGLATVLTPEHHEKCLLTLPANALPQIHVCFRQFDNEGIRPFNISEVKGYWHQKALTAIDSAFSRDSPQNCDLASDSMEMYDDEETDMGSVIRRGRRTARCSRRRMGNCDLLQGSCNGEGSLILQQDIGRLTFGSTADAGPGSSTGELKPPSNNKYDCGKDGHCYQSVPAFDVCDKIELLCQDSGVRGCWFRCTVLRKISCRVKVRYEELEVEDGHGKLEEWVSSAKVAAPDRLGMRVFGRLTMRPSPSELITPLGCGVGDAVDAWWNDGWWEGVVVGKEATGEVRVYFPGENDTSCFQVSDLRISRDWVHGQWVDVKSNGEIEKLITARASALQIDRSMFEAMDNQIQQIAPSSGGAGTCGAYLPQQSEPYQAREMLFLPSSAVPRASRIPCEGVREPEKITFFNTEGKDFDHKMEDHSVAAVVNICTGDGSELGCCNEGPTVSDKAFIEEDNVDVPTESESKKLEMDHNVCIIDRDKEHMLVDLTKCLDEIELRWKSSRKRQRQMDAQGSVRTEKAVHVLLRDDDTRDQSLLEEERVERHTEDVISPDNMKESNRRQAGDDSEEFVKAKKARPGHENLKPMHGPSIGGSLFMNSVPLASLVMSR